METKKFYERCSRMLQDVKEKRTGIKTACYKTEMPTKYMAVISSIIRKYDVLSRVVGALRFDIRNRWMAIVLCYEILYGNNREATRFNKKLANEVKETYKSLGIVEKTKTKEDRGQAYIRLNTLKADASAISSLSLEPTIVPDVYKVMEKVNWIKLKSYQEGYFFVQDLSSCLPAYVLNPPKNSVVLDACSAPGNKTTHLAMLSPTSVIYAVEKDMERYKTLREMIEKSGAENIVSMHCDFLGITKEVEDVFKAEYILVDPSCSGSGIHPGEEKDYARISKLSAFQVKILNKALSYPRAKKVVYSTCSIYEEENEGVVSQALKANPGYVLEKALPAWSKRGAPGYEFSEKVVRCDADMETKGFFLASFVRKDSK
ncbi:25S rRNA (cytosine2278-C5)-methyltransferase [Nematocida major]|uniref:25S rRNA (cytosine2278-C5)-methyltransferase n=1 Tax=Nematocida major TaxID=1912982 RepID=UPI002007D7F3|nr:25S rRNA (cytosine2278-C5)-methyltransferase [Nematocida major]KAH9385160.1 25S rRNA (cytosine2278-C5)-methyltransferase [Nematocida major]